MDILVNESKIPFLCYSPFIICPSVCITKMIKGDNKNVKEIKNKTNKYQMYLVAKMKWREVYEYSSKQ